MEYTTGHMSIMRDTVMSENGVSDVVLSIFGDLPSNILTMFILDSQVTISNVGNYGRAQNDFIFTLFSSISRTVYEWIW